MRTLVFGSLLLPLLASSLHAQIRQFPYEAVVEGSEVYVRSGPGQKYYPTTKLAKGARVVVHRHDPGGWYMIEPPEGSFSWIRADDVEPVGGQRGNLKANNVVVRVGSNFGDTRDVWQRKLSIGSQVEILGEQTLQTENGPVRMYKIRPPKGEWRWISGQFLTPVDQMVRMQQDRDPFARPSNGKPPQVDPVPAEFASSSTQVGRPAMAAPSGPQLVERPVTRTYDHTAVSRSAPPPDELAADRARLQQLDEQFRSIVDRDISEWDFVGLEQGYRQLQQQVSLPAFSSQIDLRLAAVERYRRSKQEYDEFMALTTATSQRDAELAAQQMQILPVSQNTILSMPTPAVPEPSAQPAPEAVPPASLPPASTTPGAAPPSLPTMSLPASPQPQIPVATPHAPVLQQPHQPAPYHPQQPVMQPAAPPASVPPGHSTQGPSGLVPAPIDLDPGFEPVQQFAPQSVQPSPSQTPVSPVTPGSTPGGVIAPQQPASAPVPQESTTTTTMTMVGAGIVQRSAIAFEGTPRHVLIHPNGRILAYLEATGGVNLDQYVGQPLGIFGERAYRQDLQAETITVDSVMPVRLQP